MNGTVDRLLRRFITAGLLLILIYTVAAAWVYEIWAMLAAQAALFLLFLPLGSLCIVRGRWPGKTSIVIPLIGAVIWGLLQLRIGTTADRFVTELIVIRTASAACGMILAIYICEDSDSAHVFLDSLVALGTIVAVLATIQRFSSETSFWVVRSAHTLLPMGPFLSRDSYSAFVELILPVALWRASRSPRAWIFVSCSALLYASVIVSLSRAGAVLTTLEVVGVAALACLQHPQLSAKAAIARMIVIIVPVLSFAAIFGWEDLFKRFAMVDPWQMRREYFASSVAMIRSRPLIGFGLGTWPIVYPQFATIDMGAAGPHAHNDWIEWASDGGVPYLLLLLVPPLHVCKRILRRPWGMGILAMSLHALVDFPFQVYSLLLLFFVLVAVVETEGRVTLSNGWTVRRSTLSDRTIARTSPAVLR